MGIKNFTRFDWYLVLGLVVLSLVLLVFVVRLIEKTKPMLLPADPQSREMVFISRADLAVRMETDASQIDFIRFQKTVWRDSSLGCPQPGMMYLQVLTPGYFIEFWAGGRIYRYHGGDGQMPFLCANPSEP